jgi:trans-aconitate 2-methyltransferase
VTWSAKQYVAFEDERTRPVRDLLSAVPAREVRLAVDIGCGPGNSTEVLAARFPQADVSGFDSSPDMIDAARKRLPKLRFDVLDLVRWIDHEPSAARGPFDCLLANAVLQWVPDHANLFPALVRKLAPGGCLAVQVPDNLAERAQVLMREIAAESPWRAKLAGAEGARVRIESPEWYYNLLRPQCARVDVWRTTYYHPLASPAEIVEWFKGTGLRPFLDPLTQEERDEYLARYTARIGESHPSIQGGGVMLPFPRLFILATRA